MNISTNAFFRALYFPGKAFQPQLSYTQNFVVSDVLERLTFC